MEITQKSKLTNDEVNNIVELLRSSDNNNRQLGIVLALSQDMDIEVLVNGVLNKKWCYNSYYAIGFPNYTIGNFEAVMYSNHSDLIHSVEEEYNMPERHLSKPEAIYQLIHHFIKSEYPHLLSKIKPFETLKP
jgi:hypothetical protein